MPGITLITQGGVFPEIDGTVEGEDLWIPVSVVGEATGFELKPEGLCRADLCYPLPPGRELEYVRDGQLNIAAFWRHRSAAIVSSRDCDVWSLSEPASEIASRLQSLEAPNFQLPDVHGILHSLSDFRGKKVMLSSWASWCGCRADLPVWQSLQEELGEEGFTVIAVALDSVPGAAEPWIEQASPTYPALIDAQHQLAELYNLVNVPQTVWIDEEGHIVRTQEVTGWYMPLTKRDPATGRMPEGTAELQGQVKTHYFEALRDWVANGEASPYVLSEDQARSRVSLPDDNVALAHAYRRLGEYLNSRGRTEEGKSCYDEALRLHPDSWAIFRQGAEKLENGIAAATDFRQRLTDRSGIDYYAPIDMPGMPSLS